MDGIVFHVSLFSECYLTQVRELYFKIFTDVCLG